MKLDSLKGYGAVLLSACMFGTYGIWSVLLGEANFGVFYQGWVRAAIILLLLTPLVWASKGFKKLRRRDLKWIVIYAALCLGTQAPLYYAFITTGIGTATLIFYAAFVMASYAVAKLFLNEIITKVKILAFVLAFAGLLLVFGFSILHFSAAGLLFAAINGLASGGEVSFTKKLTHYSSLYIAWIGWFVIFVSHLLFSLLLGEHQHIPQLTTTWGVMFTYAIAGLLGFWLVVEGFRKIDASIGSLIGLCEILFGVLFGTLIFHEHVGISTLIGGTFIIIAALLPDLVVIINRKRSKQSETLA